jgi:hypothetical protein
MRRYVCSKANQDEVNADLRARFGDTCTRSQIMEYREETGIDPRWIRKGSACNVGRGLYRIPGGSDDAPALVRPIPKPARREKVQTEERSVISSPFDDGHYDEPETEDAPADETPKRGRQPKAPKAEPLAGRVLDEHGEIPRPVYVHAWVCDARSENMCPGRKPGNFYLPDGSCPKCECGSSMSRHAWAPGKKVF